MTRDSNGVEVKSIRSWVNGKQSTRVISLTIDGRPLVVIDPDDDAQVERLSREFFDSLGGPSVVDGDRAMQLALRGLVKPRQQVYEHLVVSERPYGDRLTLESFCGKVWRSSDRSEVDVLGRCPDCDAATKAKWSA